MHVPSPGVVFHLCLIILACTHVSGGEEVPDTVNGLINQSILMSLANDSPPSIQQVIWNFGRNPLLTYSNNQIIYIEDSFEGRLEILDDGRSLKIRNLRLEDSALYTATITFTDKTKDRKTYNLTVYEPVPTPSIKIAKKKTDDWCNATLYCSAPKNKSSLSYTWNYKMYRNSTYQQYNSSGDTIEITLQKGSWDMEFMCIVQNPADRKNVSEQNICLYNDRRQENAPNGPRTYGLLGLVLIIPLAFLGWYFIMKRKRRKGTPDVTENKNGEPQYIQVTTIQQNADRQEWNNSLYDSSPQQKPKAVTVYATLEHPPETKR